MDDKYLWVGFGEMAYPFQKVFLICMGRKSANGENLCLYCNVFSENLYVFGSIYYLSSCGSLSLESYDDNTCSRAPKVMFEIIAEPGVSLMAMDSSVVGVKCRFGISKGSKP
jgi:hypothetical protein